MVNSNKNMVCSDFELRFKTLKLNYIFWISRLENNIKTICEAILNINAAGYGYQHQAGYGYKRKTFDHFKEAFSYKGSRSTWPQVNSSYENLVVTIKTWKY